MRAPATTMLREWLKRRFKVLVRLVISIALIGGLAYQIGSADIVGQIKAVRWTTLAVVVIVLAANVLFVTPRWAMVLRTLGSHISSATLFASVVLGFFLNQVLPTGVGGDVVRVWRARQLGVPLEIAIHSVLLDRAAAVVVAFVGVIALLPFLTLDIGRREIRLLVLIAVLGAAGCIGLWMLSRVRHFQLPLVASVQRAILSFSRNTWSLLADWKAAILIFALAALNQCLPILAIWMLVRELGIVVQALDVAFVTLMSTVAAAIPISFAGWGIREGALVVMFGLYGVPADVAFAVSVLYGACMTLASAPGALMLLGRGTMPATDRAP